MLKWTDLPEVQYNSIFSLSLVHAYLIGLQNWIDPYQFITACTHVNHFFSMEQGSLSCI